MYTLFIVDDESHARLGLCAWDGWTRNRIQVVGDAEDGDVALARILELKPDILFTDVKMPNMDGITLAMNVQRHLPAIKVVFVSGHDDAQYLKSALKIEAVDYLFKSIDLEELEAVAQRVVSILDSERESRDEWARRSVERESALPKIRRIELMQLIQGDTAFDGSDEQAFRAGLAASGLAFSDADRFCLLLVDLDRKQCLPQADPGFMDRLRQSCQAAVGAFSYEEIPLLQHGQALFLVWSETLDKARIAGLAAQIHDHVEDQLGCTVTLVTSDIFFDIGGMRRRYQEMVSVKTHKFLLGYRHTFSCPPDEPPLQPAGLPDPIPVHALADALINAIRIDDAQRIQTLMANQVQAYACWPVSRISDIRNALTQTFLQVSAAVFKECDTPAAHTEQQAVWNRIFAMETLADLHELLAGYFQKARQLQAEKRIPRTSLVVVQIREYIARHHASDISVQDIAAAIYLSPNYISQIFKQETGQTINEHLTEVRIDRAIGMLKDPQYKLHDIGQLVGYPSVSYFCRIFKKSVGCTPSEYRERVIYHG